MSHICVLKDANDVEETVYGHNVRQEVVTKTYICVVNISYFQEGKGRKIHTLSLGGAFDESSNVPHLKVSRDSIHCLDGFAQPIESLIGNRHTSYGEEKEGERCDGEEKEGEDCESNGEDKEGERRGERRGQKRREERCTLIRLDGTKRN